jgi:RNA polymerase sigma-70 factor (ECF subfamily)
MTAADESLVQSAQQGDRAAFEELVRRTSRLIYARLYLETGDAHRAEDLLQETLLVAFRRLNDLANPGSFRAWLLNIAQSVAIDAGRRDARKKRVGPRAAVVMDEVPGKARQASDEAERSEQRDKVLAALRSLPEEYRLPLTLRYLGGSDYETIQTQLGLSNGSLRGLLHRGLKLLRARLAPEYGDDFRGD